MGADAPTLFPNPDQSARIVLYPLTGGGVALEWQLPSALIEHAVRAFSSPDPVPKLYLHRADDSGSIVAEADLSDHPAGGQSGYARFEAPIVGPLQAELGLEGRHDGGWLLLGRSNRVDVVPRSDALPDAAAGATPRGLLAQPVSPPIDAPAPSFPPLDGEPAEREAEPEPPSDAGASIPGEIVSGPIASVGARAVSAPGSARGVIDCPIVPSRFPDRSLTAELPSPLAFGRWFPMVTSVSGDPRAAHLRSGSALQPEGGPHSPIPQSALSALQHRAAEPDHRQTGTGSTEYPDKHGKFADRQASRHDDAGPAPSKVRGSGPLAPYPSQDPAVIRGQLRVFGRAAAGTLLNLGGHRFRVGPGGRFSFTIDLDDPALLASLLARLPRLPVAERDS